MNIRDRIVSDWRRAHKWASVRLSALGATVFGALAAFPQLATEAWNALPQSLREMLPANLTQLFAAGLFLAVIYGRVTKKKDKADG